MFRTASLTTLELALATASAAHLPLHKPRIARELEMASKHDLNTCLHFSGFRLLGLPTSGEVEVEVEVEIEGRVPAPAEQDPAISRCRRRSEAAAAAQVTWIVG